MPPQALENFVNYQSKIESEKKLIEKICNNKDLTDLILNLYKFKVLYRKMTTEDTLNKTRQRYQNSTSSLLAPSLPAQAPTNKNILDKLSSIKKENRQHQKYIKTLEKKIAIIESLQTAAMKNLENAKAENHKLKQQLKNQQIEDNKSKHLLYNF